MNKFSSPEHGGTHVDAQSHFIESGRHVGDIELRRLIGPAVIIDAVAQAEKDPNYEVTVDDLERWESQHGRMPDGAFVLLNFNWSIRWPDADRFFGTLDPGTKSRNKTNPGLHPDAALWLVKERPRVKAVGSDTCSVDHGPSKGYRTHTTLLSKEIYPVENIANIDKVPNYATVFAIPMKIKDGTGAPVRIFAVIAEVDTDSWISTNVCIITVLYTTALLLVLNWRR